MFSALWMCELALEHGKDESSLGNNDFATDIATNEGRIRPSGVQEEDVTGDASQVEDDENCRPMAKKNTGKIWKTMAWATYDGNVTVRVKPFDPF